MTFHQYFAMKWATAIFEFEIVWRVVAVVAVLYLVFFVVREVVRLAK